MRESQIICLRPTEIETYWTSLNQTIAPDNDVRKSNVSAGKPQLRFSRAICRKSRDPGNGNNYIATEHCCSIVAVVHFFPHYAYPALTQLTSLLPTVVYPLFDSLGQKENGQCERAHVTTQHRGVEGTSFNN